MNPPSRRLTRRTVLGVGATGLAVGAGAIVLPRLTSDTPQRIVPSSPQVAATERLREATGATVSRSLRAAPAEIDLGGRTVATWAYDGSLPGPEIRVTAGDRLRISLANELPTTTTIHWHGLALRNDMDGVPTLTQDAVPAAETFLYDFIVPDPGTYWFHPHVGVQLDTGLYAPLIVEDPSEPGAYDDEVVLVLDDWTDGWGPAPDDILRDLASNGMSGMEAMGDTDMPTGVGPDTPLGTDTGDVKYPAHLVNGRLPAAPDVIRSKPRDRLRLRIINAASDTAYRLAVAGHRLTLTHTDGFAVEPVEVDALLIGMGERYDVTVDVQDGTFPVVAWPEGKSDPAGRAMLTTEPGPPRRVGARRPEELDGRLLTYDDLDAATGVALSSKSSDRELEMTLQMGDEGRQWLINDRTFADHEPLTVEPGERIRLTLTNESTMFHPMHLHGHTFAISRESGNGPRKDTINVLPKSTMVVEFDAENPGQWLAHCHNAYHGELGMMTVLSYVAS